MSTRQEVYDAIEGERYYQNRQWSNPVAKWGDALYRSAAGRPTEDWLVLILGYYHDAVAYASHKPGNYIVLDIVRKLAGLCVACMEVNGIQRRNLRAPLQPGPIGRPLIYNAIDGEREYQNALGSERCKSSSKTPCGYLCMFHTYLNRAITGWTENAGDREALDNVRKMAAICVRCMEEHGAIERLITADWESPE